jgi:tetratricopeptide (TPR) repeat protein
MRIAKSTLILFTVFYSFNTNAQTKEIQNAFSQSYDYEAIAKYEAAINSITPVYREDSYESNLRLGWLYYMQGKNKESISYYNKAISLMPAATEPKWAILNPLSKIENYSEIEKTYLSILKLDPKNNNANYNLGLMYYYRKDFFSAKKYFDVALNQNPFNYNNMLMSAWTNYFLGNKNDAKILFNKVLLYSPNDTSASEGLSLIK